MKGFDQPEPEGATQESQVMCFSEKLLGYWTSIKILNICFPGKLLDSWEYIKILIFTIRN